MPNPRAASFSFVSSLALAAPSAAQWPTSAAANLSVAAFSGEQTLCKSAPTSDGGVWLGWFDQRGGSYAVYVQRLDAAGVEQLTPGGLPVSNHPQSTSLQDWDLICDSQDHCVLTFTDTRAVGDLDVQAYRIAPDGTFIWGPNGVTLSNNGDFEGNPKVCETSIGDFAFVWSKGGSLTLQLQRVDVVGTATYAGDGVAIAGDVGATPGFVRIAAADAGAVILSWVRTTAFSGNKHVHAQKYDVAGTPLWNGGVRIAVFDLASVPLAHEPRLIPDGAGGAVVAWHYSAGSVFEVRVQHVDANGTELFGHNGVNVSNSANSEMDPAIVWQASSQSVFVAFHERNAGQSIWGNRAQRLDPTGAPLWGATGVQLLPFDTVTKFAPVAAPYGTTGMCTAVLEQSLGGQNDQVTVFGLDENGAALWAPHAASTVASDKLRLGINTGPSGTTVLTWTDKRTDGGDVYLHAVDAAGSRTITVGSTTPYGCGVNPPGSLVATGRPAIGIGGGFELSNPLGTQPAGTIGLVFLCIAQAPGFPCGVVLPGFGMAGPGANGEILVDIDQPFLGLLGIYMGPGTSVQVGYGMPLDATMLGDTLYAQGVIIDFAPGAPIPFGVSNGLVVDLGS